MFKSERIVLNSVLLIILLIFQNFEVSSQKNNYAVSGIPDSLENHADAVIRIQQTDININSKKSCDIYTKEAITILKKSGEKFAYIYIPYDNNLIKFVSFKGKVFDKNGLLVKTFKKKDVKDISYYEGLYSENRIKYTEKPALNPPYTIEYEVKLHYNGFLNIERWVPVPYYKVSLQKSVLNIFSPEKYQYRVKEINFHGTKDEEKLNSLVRKTWKIENLNAVIPEPYNNSLLNLVPAVYIDPVDFYLEGFFGTMDTWQNFGKWILKLNEGRDKLPEKTISDIKNLIKNIHDDKTKAKIIYEYMQNRTRYVSIQLGIGGWQPFEAGYTDKNGYGDCKALTYYMQSLLKVAGIKSYYTIVRAGADSPDIYSDYPSQQFNHAILCLPFNNDTTWLECTSQKIPFGYISDFTDDRDVLVITEDGGKLMHTEYYSEKINTLNRKAEINLKLNGNIKADIYAKYRGLQYDLISQMSDLPAEKKLKKIKNNISLSGLSVDSFNYCNYKNIIPYADEYLKIRINNYASVSSGRVFLIPNMFNRITKIPKKLKNRKSNIRLKTAYSDTDTLIYRLPENIEPEFIPENAEKKTKFGEYSAKIEIVNGKLIYIRKLIMHKGTFSAEDYDDFRNFLKFIAKSDKQTCVFKIKDN